MHYAPLLFPVLQAIGLAVIGYFLVFAASHKQGLLRHLGNVLGAIVFAVALVVLVGWLLVPRGEWGYRGMMSGARPSWMHPLVQPPTAEPVEPPAPAKPAQ